jgi:hypothetical protein
VSVCMLLCMPLCVVALLVLLHASTRLGALGLLLRLVVNGLVFCVTSSSTCTCVECVPGSLKALFIGGCVTLPAAGGSLPTHTYNSGCFASAVCMCGGRPFMCWFEGGGAWVADPTCSLFSCGSVGGDSGGWSCPGFPALFLLSDSCSLTYRLVQRVE